MAKNEQEKADADSQKALTEVLKAVVKPFEDTLKAFQTSQLNISKGVQQNAKNIKTLAEKEPASIIPKELQAIIPDIISGIFDLFTKPDTPPALASQGILNERMQKAFENSTVARWENDTLIQAEQLITMRKENALRDKRLEDGYYGG